MNATLQFQQTCWHKKCNEHAIDSAPQAEIVFPRTHQLSTTQEFGLAGSTKCNTSTQRNRESSEQTAHAQPQAGQEEGLSTFSVANIFQQPMYLMLLHACESERFQSPSSGQAGSVVETCCRCREPPAGSCPHRRKNAHLLPDSSSLLHNRWLHAAKHAIKATIRVIVHFRQRVIVHFRHRVIVHFRHVVTANENAQSLGGYR